MNFNELQTANGRKFVFINVRSLLPNINLMRHDFELSNFTIIGISETWLNKRIPDPLVSMRGFNLIRLDRKGDKRGGGLLIYINNTLDYECTPDCLNHSSKDIELLTVLIKPMHQKNFLVSLIYIPPSADKTLAIETLESLSFPDKKYERAVRIIAGDFNMDASGINNRHKESALIKSLEGKLKITQLIKKPTRVTTKNSSLIDLLFISVSNISNVMKSDSVEYNISDHNLIYLVYKKEHSPKQITSFTFRSRKGYNLAILLHKLDNWDWGGFYEIRDPEYAWNSLYNAYNTVLNEIAPLLTKNKSPLGMNGLIVNAY